MGGGLGGVRVREREEKKKTLFPAPLSVFLSPQRSRNNSIGNVCFIVFLSF